MPKNREPSLEKISPSKFMRDLRPEYYSDTEDRVAYVLDAPAFEYHLESISKRNQTHEFEIFCRKLCERVICPNLRPQTGPEGGGDSKADTESYPVADEIAALTYVGEANEGRERWAFAFSAKESWATKVRADVKGIVETGRDYKRIIFITSRFARAKDRARIEDQLSKQYGIPVTIHDRSWIVKEIIENDRKDIAFNYLRVGEAKSDPFRLGPKDYSRKQQIEDIERLIDDPEAFCSMERQRVTEALVAAKLSRNLELPRTETDGRFLRAIRLADADGTYRQQLEARYEHVWTSFWWFDDFQFLKDSYEPFETLALNSDHAINLEFLCNLLQLLVNSVIHGHMSRDECRLDERTSRLKLALEQIALKEDRPNNSLEAQTSLLIIRMNQVLLDKRDNEWTDIWHDFSEILESATGLGEFNADRLIDIVEIAGQIAGNDPAYNELIEKMAEFVSKRKSEAEGALMLLKRAQKLDFSDNLDMIRLLGKAAIGLIKKEYSDYLIEALQLMMLAYRSAGMLWAARATCIALSASLVIEGEKESQVPPSFVPTMKIWAWIAFELGHLPDFLLAIQLLNGSLVTLPLTEESEIAVKEDIRDLDLALGSLFLNLNETHLSKLEKLPDILDAMGLYMARSALLYALGYSDVLREDGSLPLTESDEEANRIFSMLASQPVAQSLHGSLIINEHAAQLLSTRILGLTIEINIEGSPQSILIAEAVLGSLEAFFVTAIANRAISHTEKLRINVLESDDISKPSFVINRMDMVGILTWPRTLSVTSYEKQDDVHTILNEVSGYVLISCCVAEDMESLLKSLYANDSVHHRMGMVTFATSSYHRVTSRNISQLEDWQEAVKRAYELRAVRPILAKIKLEGKNARAEDSGPLEINDHRALSVRSVIDIHAWDQARWRGTGFAQFTPDSPPCIALLFEHEEGARKIFEHWQERFGKYDKNNEIYFSIIRQLPGHDKHHYSVIITSKLPEVEDSKPKQLIAMSSRSMVMEPDTDLNLERFLESYRQFRAFYLMPALLTNAGPSKLLFDFAILKKNLIVKLAADVGENDIESITLRRLLSGSQH